MLEELLAKSEELDLFFRVTLYPQAVKKTPQQSWYQPVFEHIQKYGKIPAMEADKIWKVTRKTANQHLKQLCKEGLLIEVSKGPFGPLQSLHLSRTWEKVGIKNSKFFFLYSQVKTEPRL